MRLHNQFVVPLQLDHTWEVLTDMPRIAPCLPGARLDGVDGEYFRGSVQVKLGPVSTSYQGRARFAVRDRARQQLVLKAEGRDDRGQGGAQATISVQLAPDKDGTVVRVATDLALSGKVAQLGSGMIRNVSSQLVDEFVRRLEATVIDAGGAPPPGGSDQIDLLRVTSITRYARLVTAAVAGFGAGWTLVHIARRLRRLHRRS
jgi:hypothetical protein